MLYLSGGIHDDLYGQPYIGWMLTPYMGNKKPIRHNWWASDTGCYTGEFKEKRYFKWLHKMHPHRFTCLFAAAPDVVPMRLKAQGLDPNQAGIMTLEKAAPYFPRIRDAGFRTALVAQNGMEHLELPWDSFDAVFIGGDEGFKYGDAARTIIERAKREHKWVHMGRVNSLKRLRYSIALGCDSVDGTYITYGPDKNIPNLIRWITKVNAAELAA